MSLDVDTRGRSAAVGLREAVAAADFTSVAPARRGRPVIAVLRPAVILGLLLIAAAVGAKVIIDSAENTAPVVPTTIPTVTTFAESAPEPAPAPPTTAYAVPVSPSTVAPGDTEAPHLEITYPTEGEHLEVKTVTFAGVTEPGARVFAGPYEADVHSSGEWEIVLILNEGANVARFVARDAAGNESTAAVTVHYTPAATTTTVAPKTTTTEKETLAEFTAFAKFGSCAETPPYDEYYGTGEPGSVVEITSEHGSASTTVNSEGHWEKKVFFETAPENETFLVTVTDQFGRKAKFEFVHTTG